MTKFNSKDNVDFNQIIKKYEEKLNKRFGWAFPSE